MKNIIVLGRPRAGKSTLANLITKKYHYQLIRLDVIRDSFAKVFPELDIAPYTAIENEKYLEFINQFMEYSKEEDREQYGYVIEGCDIKLEDCNKVYDYKNSLIYILAQIDITPEEMAKSIKEYDTNYDWTYNKTLEELIPYCKSSIEKGKVLKEKASKYGLKFYDTAKNREEVLNEIMEDIAKNID